ncbi:MAG: plasmid mobilization protein [Dissulfurispiraceae bacterium]
MSNTSKPRGVRFSDDEFEGLSNKAKAEGLSVSEFIRRSVLVEQAVQQDVEHDGSVKAAVEQSVEQCLSALSTGELLDELERRETDTEHATSPLDRALDTMDKTIDGFCGSINRMSEMLSAYEERRAN